MVPAGTRKAALNLSAAILGVEIKKKRRKDGEKEEKNMKKQYYLPLFALLCAAGATEITAARRAGSTKQPMDKKALPLQVEQKNYVDFLFTLPARKGHLTFGEELMKQNIALAIEGLPVTTDEAKKIKSDFIEEFDNTFKEKDKTYGYWKDYNYYLKGLPVIINMEAICQLEKGRLSTELKTSQEKLQGITESILNKQDELTDAEYKLGRTDMFIKNVTEFVRNDLNLAAVFNPLSEKSKLSSDECNNLKEAVAAYNNAKTTMLNNAKEFNIQARLTDVIDTSIADLADRKVKKCKSSAPSSADTK